MRNLQKDSPIVTAGTHPKKKITAAIKKGATSKNPNPSRNAQSIHKPTRYIHMP